MNLTIKNSMYHFAYYLVKDENYDVVYIDPIEDEVWVRKTHKKNTTVIRIINQQFNWKNHLKTDIAKVFQQVKMMRNQIKSDNISIFNIYVSDIEPVDNWETLKNTLVLKEKNPLKMNVFYVTDDNFESEESRLVEMIDASSTFEDDMENTSYENKDLSIYKEHLIKIFKEKQAKLKQSFQKKPPFGTIAMISLMILSFLLSSFTDQNVLANFLTSGQVDSGFLHALSIATLSLFLFDDVSFLMMTIIVIYLIGVFIERLYGTWRFILIFVMSGLLGNLIGFALTPGVIADASSAVFGLFGALMFYGIIHRKVIPFKMQRNYLLLMIFSISIGIIIPEIHLSLYISGFISGILVASCLYLPRMKNIKVQAIASTVTVIFIVFLYFYL